jgi:hypothetical protein
MQRLSSRIIRLIVIATALIFVSWFGLSAHADTKAAQEYQLKAAFLYNFGKFVEWPAKSFRDAQTQFMVCVIGKDPFRGALDDIKDKSIGGRSLAVRRIAGMGDTGQCQILFISSSEKDNLPPILRVARNKSILTVGDTKGFAESGVMINLTLSNNKIGLEINSAAAEQASLKISSKLLKLGRIVE